MADEALTSLAQIKRDLAYLEEHCVIRKIYPQKSGRGHYCSYVFLELDEPMELKRRLGKIGKGVHGEPFFSQEERGSEGAQIEPERGSKGVHGARRNKEEPKSPTTASEQAQSAYPSARANGLKAKRPQVVAQFEKELRLVYEASVGARAAWSSDPLVRWKRHVDAGAVAAERCRLPVEIGLALIGLRDQQVYLLTKYPRGPDEYEANVRAAFELEQAAENSRTTGTEA
jgi:hypothetical protein